jgi:hypothetical protein
MNLYFGKRPDYFDIFLMSCGVNSRFDFIFFVDFDVPFDIPANVRFVRTSFEETRSRFQSIFNFKIALKSPYKLCDYRPAFGQIFSDYFADYEWWGHCDFDMIFGDLSPIYELAKKGEFVKILRRGHLSLYRNTADINSVYKDGAGRLDWKEVFANDTFFIFDESNGIDTTFLALQLPVFRDEVIADISPKSAFLHMTKHRNYLGQYFHWVNGKLICKGLLTEEREFLYLHLQKRRLSSMHVGGSLAQSLLINQFGIFGEKSRFKSRLLRLISLMPNIAHLWRFYFPRVIRFLGSRLRIDAYHPRNLKV